MLVMHYNYISISGADGVGRDVGGQQHGLAVPGAAAGGRHAAGELWLVEAGHVTTVLTSDWSAADLPRAGPEPRQSRVRLPGGVPVQAVPRVAPVPSPDRHTGHR